MTNHIEEMMRTAGCKQQYCGWLDMGDLDTQYQFVRCDTLEEWNYEAEFSRTSYSCDDENEDWKIPELKYPDFTAEKQLEIIKLIGIIKDFICEKDFAQSLAKHTTELMNKGELDKQKVKEILEG